MDALTDSALASGAPDGPRRWRNTIYRYQDVLISVALFLLAFAPRGMGLAVFSTVDERTWLGRSFDFLKSVSQGDWAGTMGTIHPGVTTRWSGALGIMAYYLPDISFQATGILVDGVPLAEVYQPSLQLLASARYPAVLLTSGCVVIAYHLLRNSLGRRVAVLAAVFFALDPFYVALSRVLHNDALHATFALLSVLSLGLALSDKKLEWFAVSGVCGGLAFLSKSPAVVLTVLVPVTSLIVYVLQSREDRRWYEVVGGLLVWYGAGAIAIFAIWPSMWVQPLVSIKYVLVGGTALGGDTHANFFWGRAVRDPGPLFYPVAILFRGSPLVLAGAGASLVCLGTWFRKRAESAITHKEILILSLWGMIAAYVLLLSLGAKKFDRYALPAFLAIDILGAIGFIAILKVAATRCRLGGRRLVLGLGLTLAILLQILLCLSHYPYYFSYYNPVLGGGRAATEVMLVDWDVGYDQAAQYLDAKGNAEMLSVGAAGYSDQLDWKKYFRGRVFRFPARTYVKSLQLPWPQLDYLVVYVGWLQRNALPPLFADLVVPDGPEHVVNINGIDYAWIYKIPKDEFLSLPSDAIAVGAHYENGLTLAGYDMHSVRTDQDGRQLLPVTLYWKVTPPVDPQYKLALKLVNDMSTIWAIEEKKDRPPWGPRDDREWRSFWRTDVIFPDEHELELYPGTPPGSYNIEALIVYHADGRELAPDGNARILLGPVDVPLNVSLTADALDIENAVSAKLSDKIVFLGWSAARGESPGAKLHLTFFWQCLLPMEERYTTFVHVVDHEGNLVTQKDSEPVTGFHPTSRWQVGEIIRDQYEITFPEELEGAASGLRIGMYLPSTGERLPVVLADGEQPVDRAISLP